MVGVTRTECSIWAEWKYEKMNFFPCELQFRYETLRNGYRTVSQPIEALPHPRIEADLKSSAPLVHFIYLSSFDEAPMTRGQKMISSQWLACRWTIQMSISKKQNKHTPNISHFSCKCIRVVLACIFHTHLLIGHYSVSLFIFGIRMQSKKLKLSYSTHVHMFTCSNTAPKTAIFAKESKDASNIDRRPKSFWTKFKITHLVLFFCFARSSTDLRRRFHRFWRNCHFLFLSFLCLSIMSFTHLLGQATAFAYWPSWSASECVYWTHHIIV